MRGPAAAALPVAAVLTVAEAAVTTAAAVSSASVPATVPFDFFTVLITLLVLCMILVTMAGNAMVCLAVLLVRRLKQPPNFLLVSLAVADFFVGSVVMPLALVSLVSGTHWPLGRLLCHLWTSADLALCTASIVSLCVISVDRYLAISRPLRYSAQRTTRRVLVYIGVVWAIAGVVSCSSLALPPLLHAPPPPPHTCQVTQHLGYQVYATMTSFYLPTCIMLFVYAKIWRAAKRLARQDRVMSADAGSFHHQSDKEALHKPEHHYEQTLLEVNGNLKAVMPAVHGRSGKKEEKRLLHRPSAIFQAVKLHARASASEKSDCKAQKTLGVMMGIYVICWLPFFLLAIFKPLYAARGGGANVVPFWLDSLTLWLGYSNSMLNPMIYAKYNKEFRVPFREMLSCRFSTLQVVMRQETFTHRFGEPRSRRAESSVTSNGNIDAMDL